MTDIIINVDEITNKELDDVIPIISSDDELNFSENTLSSSDSLNFLIKENTNIKKKKKSNNCCLMTVVTIGTFIICCFIAVI